MSKKHSQTDPSIETDADILAALAAHPGLLDIAKSEADAAINAARALYQFPGEYLVWKTAQYSLRLRQANAMNPHGLTAIPRSEIDRQNVAHFRIYREAAAFFSEMRRTWPTEMLALRTRISALIKEREDAERIAQFASFAPPPQAFNASAFLQRLVGQGLSFHRCGEEKFEVTPRSKITVGDRAMIEANRGAIFAALTEEAEVF